MFEGKKCLVVGSGISGIAAVRLLEELGAKVTIYDSNESLSEEELQKKLPEESSAVCVTGAVEKLGLEDDEKIREALDSHGSILDQPGKRGWDPCFRRNRAWFFTGKGKSSSHHRHQWKDHYHYAGRRYHEGMAFAGEGLCGG